MRRPPPIQPPRRPDSGAPADADTIEADQPFVSPFHRVAQRGRTAPEAPGVPQDHAVSSSSAADPVEPPVGIRDVWRAARARRRALHAEA
ncbi:MAG TPA: hypothetical protein VJR25_12855, partial [Microbacterium sp.]|nr:hypothetical protein [Microbacterium sp.]